MRVHCTAMFTYNIYVHVHVNEGTLYSNVHIQYICTVRTVGKFRGCLNFVNFMVGLKSRNLTPTTPLQLNGHDMPPRNIIPLNNGRDKTRNFRPSKFTNRTVLHMFYNNSLTQIRIVPIYTVQICSLVSREYIFATHNVIQYITKKLEPKAIYPTRILYCTR